MCVLFLDVDSKAADRDDVVNDRKSEDAEHVGRAHVEQDVHQHCLPEK